MKYNRLCGTCTPTGTVESVVLVNKAHAGGVEATSIVRSASLVAWTLIRRPVS